VQGAPKLVLICVFWELSTLSATISALLQSGFAEDDIHAIGVLEGSLPAGREYLLNIGLPSDVAELYGSCFEDGAVLLMVRVDYARQRTIAVELLQRYGVSTTLANVGPTTLLQVKENRRK